jgi:LuxR family transcriptional regulator, maltose regulon positive regulatory protein
MIKSMAFSPLSTKFHLPRARANAVLRSRLIEKLLAGVRNPKSLVLLSGPAGFGKTTLLSTFAVDFQLPVAWVSLDEADNDPIQFWTYFLTACQSVRSDIGVSGLALLQSPLPIPNETMPTILINDLVRWGGDLVIVLDDYHVIQNSAIHLALAFLLDHLPENLHIVISTRVDPPWPLARFRARSQLIEIRAADLRFTVEETSIFLNEVMRLDLPIRAVAALEARTEGWIASLQLAAISMKGRSDLTGFIEAFTGSHMYVAEYLIEEILERQPEEVKTFLMQSSILKRLNASLCEAITGHVESQALLKNLYQANLFVNPLDDEGQWFRYHQLFMDLLRARLQQTLPADSIALLHKRAATWYEQAGMMPDAIEHALLAPDYSHAAQLIEQTVMPMILKAYFITVEQWLQMIPPEYFHQSRRANMAFAWMYLTRRNFAQAAPYLERLQALFSVLREDEVDASLEGEWFALQSTLLSMQGKVEEGIALAEKALKILPEDETQVRSMTYMGLANMYQQVLDYGRATEAMEAIIQHARAAGDLASEVLGLSLLGRMLLQQGGLHSVYEITSQALQRIERAGSLSPFSATLYGELAQVYYHWHQLEEARRYFWRSVELSTLGGFSDAEIYHSVFLSRLFQMEGNLQASAQEIEKALARMQTAAPAFVREEVIAQQVSVSLALDRLPIAQMALKEFGFAFDGGFSYPEFAPEAGIPHPVGLLYNSALRVLLYRANTKRKQELGHGLELANLLITGTLRCRHLPIVLQTMLLRSQLHMKLGDEQTGLADVAKALELAESEGFISLFIEEGMPIAEALKTLLRRDLLGDVKPDYVQGILAAFPGKQLSQARHSKSPVLPAHTARTAVAGDEYLALIDPLTSRELEVLQHIAAGDSNQMIADQLVITLSAVKKHTGNIFKKLNVNSRIQAVVRARALDLLASDE